MKRNLMMWSFALVLLASNISKAQVTYPEVGKPMPEDFVLRNIAYYNKKQATMADFKGKWLLLDFWNLHCGACIASFPKVNKQMQDFKGKVQFMLVGAANAADPKGATEERFAAIRKHARLQLPCAFDASLYERFDLLTLPYIIVVDPEGIVKAITGDWLSNSDINDIIADKKPLRSDLEYYRKHEEKPKEIDYNPDKLLLVNNNGGRDSDFQYRSLLRKSEPDYAMHYIFTHGQIANAKNGLYQRVGADLIDLYKSAFMGQIFGVFLVKSDSTFLVNFWPKVVLEVKDSSMLVPSRKDNRYAGTTDAHNAYCYSLKVPPSKATKGYMMSIMQDDLKHYFGYDARIEERKMPVLKLVIFDQKKLKLWHLGDTSRSRAIKPPLNIYHANYSILQLMYLLSELSRTTRINLPVVDDTAIHGNINFTENCYWTDYNDVRKTLNANGLDIVRGTKVMKVLVIRDPKPEMASD